MNKIVRKALKCMFWALYGFWILLFIGAADCHPVHEGMSVAESKLLCWKALFAGPFAGLILPCIPEIQKYPRDFAVWLAVDAAILLLMIAFAAFRKWRYAGYALAAFAAVWFGESGGFLWRWK